MVRPVKINSKVDTWVEPYDGLVRYRIRAARRGRRYGGGLVLLEDEARRVMEQLTEALDSSVPSI